MVTGVHALIYSSEAEKVRAFFRDVLKFPSVDAGHGWLIFSLPPAELGIHPTEGATKNNLHHELYLMCDDLQATIAELQRKGVKCKPVTEAGFGSVTAIEIPGGELGLYQPRHPTALGKWK